MKKYWEYVCILILSFPPLLWFRDGHILLGHDAGFRLDYLSQIPNLFYSWDPKYNFGSDWSMFKGFIVTQMPEIAFSTLAGSFARGEQIALVFWFAVMGVGMLILLRRIFPEPKYIFFRVFTSIFYMYNFFILSGWTIGERAKFSLYAALPLGLLLLFNVFKRNTPIIRTGIMFGLLYFFLNGGGVLPLYGGTIIVFGVAFLYFARKKSLQFNAQVFAAFLLPFLLLNAYYIIPNISLLLISYGPSVGAQGGIDGLIAWERVISANASFMNLIRLQGMPSMYNNPWQPFTHILLTNPLFTAASFIPIIVILIGVMYIRPKHPFIRFLILLLPFGLIFTMGTHPPTGILFEFAMKKIPGFVMFRSSFYKFAPAFWLPMIVLTGYFLNELIRVLKYKHIRLVFGIFCIIGLLLYHYPFFTTEQFAIGNGFSTRIQIPDYLTYITRDIKRYVKENDAVLVMPKMKEFSPALPADMYTWHYFGLDIFPRNAVNRRFIANDSGDPIVSSLYNALYVGDGERFHRLAGIGGINYVLWRADAISAPDSTSRAQHMLENDPKIERVYATGQWTLYRVPNTYELAVAGAGQFKGYEGTDASGTYLAETYGHVVTPGTDFFQAECIMCDTNEYAKLVDSIVLPKTRIAPGSPLFVFEKWREDRLMAQVKGIPKERIDGDLALAIKYLAWGLPEKSRVFLQDALGMWKTLSGRDKVVYAIRLKAYLDALKQPVPDVLAKSIWMSESGVYRYITPVREGYTILTNEGSPVFTHTTDQLDFIEVHSGGSAPIVFQQKMTVSTSGVSPAITFQKLNPTTYRVHVASGGRYLLILKEQFDPRWKISIRGSHVKVDGFANGWILDEKGSYDATIYYDPQNYFYFGLWLTGITFVSSVYYVVKKKYV